MQNPSKRFSLIVGLAVLGVMIGLAWIAVGPYVTVVMATWFTLVGIVVLNLLSRRSRRARVAAFVLEWNTVFLSFLPRHLRAGIDRLRRDEQGREVEDRPPAP
jgi:hypothetical protein